jgi:hypothetical protein
MTHHLEMIRPALAIVGAGGLWLFDKIAATLSPPPVDGWGMVLDKYGLPMVLLGLSIYGGIGMYKALRASEAARIQDAKDALKQYREDAEAAQRGRAELIREMKAQTDVIRSKGQ